MFGTIFQDDGGFSVHFGKFSSDESDNSMLEIFSIIEEDRFRSIDILESLFEVMFGGSLSSFIEVFELFEESICFSLSRQEPLESGDGSIHPTRSVDARTDLESDNIRIEEF